MKMPFLKVVRCCTQYWKGGTNFRSQILWFEKNAFLYPCELKNLARIAFNEINNILPRKLIYEIAPPFKYCVLPRTTKLEKRHFNTDQPFEQ